MATGDDANMALPTLFTRTIAGHALRQCHGPRWPARRRDVSSTRQQRRIPGICAQLKQMLDSRAFRLSQIAALYAGASRGVGRQGLSQLVGRDARDLADAGGRRIRGQVQHVDTDHRGHGHVPPPLQAGRPRGEQPAGTYRPVTEEEQIHGLSFIAFRRTATLPPARGQPESYR